MIGQELVRRRDQLGLTQSELAELLGVTKQTIINYEGGSTPIPRDTELAMHALQLDRSIVTAYRQGNSIVQGLRLGQIKLEEAHKLAIASLAEIAKLEVLQPEKDEQFKFLRVFLSSIEQQRIAQRRAEEAVLMTGFDDETAGDLQPFPKPARPIGPFKAKRR